MLSSYILALCNGRVPISIKACLQCRDAAGATAGVETAGVGTTHGAGTTNGAAAIGS